ncbi:MAG: beta-ketoacyl synthase, partial [Aquimonas sp.]|nr:beta-ketoacyl synthase [Aquimonas sp.]
KRLTDAVADGDRVLGVIRGVGLSNDGRSGGFLSPSQVGQVRSMRSALAQAQLGAAQIQYVECHATGTPTGDATEIASLATVYGPSLQLPLGSLKANLGHLITASGVAGLLKVLSAMEHAQVPGTPGTRPLTAALDGTGVDVPEHGRAWEAHQAQRTAAVSSFGFGGNNAHLIVQQYAPRDAVTVAVATQIAMEFAIVGMGVRTHMDANTEAFAAHQLGESGYTGVDFDGTTLSLPAKQLAFPPADLKQALGQQLMLLEVAAEATRHIAKLDSERTGIYVGMQTDSEVCRYGLRWRWPDLMAQSGIRAGADWLGAAADALARPLDSAGVIGKMPNVPANRLNNQMNICGPGFTVSREELSGDAALELACTAIRRGEIDTALVGAVDLCREEVHAQAAREALGSGQEADAAVILVVKSLAQAQRDGDTIFAIIADPSGPVSATLSNQPGHSPIRDGLGHAHAASGLLHIALASLMLRARCVPGAKGTVQPLLRSGNPLQVRVESTSFGGEYAQWLLRESPTRAGAILRLRRAPQLYTYAAADRAALTECVRAGRIGTVGPCRLAIVAEPEQLEGLRQKALQGLSSKQLDAAWNLDGICYREGPMEGELAYAFTGAASAYKLMGRELLLGMPQLADGLSDRLRDVAATVAWAYGGQDADALRAQSPFYQLAGSSFVCQLHMQLSRDILGLRPSASLGLSSGETNAMFALGVWQDMDGLFESIQDSALYTSALANTFDAVREHWGLAAGTPVHWDNFRVSAPSALVVAAAKKMARVYVTIINSANDCVIGGDRDACQALLTALGNPPAVPLGHDLAIHCEVVTPFEPSWRALHTRPTLECNGVRFYSNYLGGVFMPDRDTV